ncbi:MAG: hypothetical protein MSH55_07620 [Enorma sp.]|uniref:hypothetical protein n=1 Tax=Enorma sp. TaxID=1920692 RepID=UPI002582F138|nr:hypothetical protein [Enorma sp.]MCI7775626.1 hypothetical protein [Enorma sp.]
MKHRWTAGVLMLCALLGFAPVAVWADNAASDNSGAVTAPASNGADEQAAEEPADKTETDAQATENGSDASSVPTEAVSQSAEPRVLQTNSLDAVYVSANGNDETGDGSQESPVASLAKAVSVVKDGGTVYVMNNLDASRLALVSEKDITIDGNGHTVTRADGFTATNDMGRGGYQPAMIEVANGSKLTLVDITLDDAFRTEGTEFEIAGDSTEDNSKKVHDGIIASYGDGHATIVLGEGTTLKNFGGLSAVYITGLDGEGATLVMKSGSKICDDNLGFRKGGYAAIFNHGGTVQAENGSSIESIDGRAIFADNGGVTTFGGAIKNITSNEVMKAAVKVGNGGQGFGGVAYYGDGHTEFTLSEGGSITDIKSHDGQVADVMLHLISCTFKMDAGSEVYGIQTIGLADMNGATVDIAGSVHDCSTGTVPFRMRGTQGSFYVREGGKIVNNQTGDVGLVYLNGGKPTIEVAGTIDTFNKPAFFISNNGSRKDGTITVTETGVITNITGDAIKASDPSTVTIQGTITNCSGYAVEYNPKGSGSLLKIEESAHIAGNHNGGAQISVVGSLTATDASEHAEIAPGAIEGNTTIDLTPFDVTLDADYAAIQLGNANSAAVTAIKDAVAAEYSDWTVVGGNALWFQPSEESVHFKASRPDSLKNTGLFAAYVPLGEEGTPNGDVELVEIENGSTIDVALDGLTSGRSYALMFVNNAEYTITADSITKYIGGGAGDETTGNGFPELTIDGSVDPIEKLEINGSEVSGDDLMAELLKNIEVVYTHEDGTVATDDSKPGEYTITLKWKNGLTNEDVRINGNNVNLDGVGTLIVRHIDDTTHAQDGSITYPLLEQEPSAPVEHAEAIAKKGGYSGTTAPTFYTNDDESREVDAEGIQLLDDSLLTDLGDGRQELMEQKAADYLGNPGEGQAYRYDFHYLDLVDAYNGNAWVSASYGTTIYLPYPEGVTKDTAESLGVQVVHYPGLHREYGIAGQAEVEEALAACELETMNIEFTDAGIKFETERAGFSPFAIVWKTDAHTIMASAGEGGTISPSGNVVVGEGADKTFVMTPDEGYTIDQVLVDGSAVELSGIVGEDGIGSYTFESIVGDHTIEVTFKKASQGGGNEGGDPGTGSTDKPKDDGLTATGDNSMVAVAGTFAAGLALVAGGYALSKKRS